MYKQTKEFKMLEIIGWIALFCGMIFLSIGGFFAALNNLGQYNIGGVPNSGLKQTLTWIGLAVILFLWYSLFKIAPFSIVVNN